MLMKSSNLLHSDVSLPVKKKKSFAADVLTLVGGTTFAQIVTILASPVLARLYTPEEFGTWALLISITMILGIIACLRYEFSIMLPDSDEEAVNLLGLSLSIVFVITAITILPIYFFKNEIALMLNSPQLGDYLWMIPLFIFVNGIFQALNYWNSRTKHFKRLSFAQVSRSLSTTGTQIVSGLIRYPLTGGLIVGNLVGNIISTLTLGGQIWRDDKNFIRANLHPQKFIQGLKRYKKFPLIDTWSALLNSISWQLPAFLLAFYFSPAVVGFYSIGFRILQMPMSFIGSSLSQVFFQRASVANSQGGLDTLVETVFKVLVIVGLFPILTLAFVGSDVFSVIFGSSWAEAGVYAQILSIWAFVWFLSHPLSSIYVVMEKQQFGLKFNIFNLITRLLSLVIGGMMGSARMALFLFALSGTFVYGYLCYKMLSYSRVKMSHVRNIILSELLLFSPVGAILFILKYFEINQYLIVGISGLFIVLYYIYVIRTDDEIYQFMKRFGPIQKIPGMRR
ncbi:membrane protein involved in the export of O-antigen and teichoic acid [Methanomethylovorans hollandica DSM 15978]|uniref:Membrane protein involved in the export of O-antigen and teichoic acid n=2 Tax=Methanomethylovorans hollandica TaxID=101192 RepID=L0KZJ9_METHD|nr:membrane protein involved in the export of O-antigen and teichoic acid [Methanomethylovorans hollandica DSM 15978]